MRDDLFGFDERVERDGAIHFGRALPDGRVTSASVPLSQDDGWPEADDYREPDHDANASRQVAYLSDLATRTARRRIAAARVLCCSPTRARSRRPSSRGRAQRRAAGVRSGQDPGDGDPDLEPSPLQAFAYCFGGSPSAALLARLARRPPEQAAQFWRDVQRVAATTRAARP